LGLHGIPFQKHLNQGQKLSGNQKTSFFPW
jgi:hypothetical protein